MGQVEAREVRLQPVVQLRTPRGQGARARADCMNAFGWETRCVRLPVLQVIRQLPAISAQDVCIDSK